MQQVPNFIHSRTQMYTLIHIYAHRVQLANFVVHYYSTSNHYCICRDVLSYAIRFFDNEVFISPAVGSIKIPNSQECVKS